MSIKQPDKWSNPLSDYFNNQINSIVEDMYRFTEEHPDWNTPQTSPDDSCWVFNKKSGCYLVGNKAHHTDTCNCSDDYDNFAQDKENW